MSVITLSNGTTIFTEDNPPISDLSPSQLDIHRHTGLPGDAPALVSNPSWLNVLNYYPSVYAVSVAGNGVSKPLSAYFSTLQAAQNFYPFVTSLSEELDGCALQLAINTAINNGTNTVYVPKSSVSYFCNTSINIDLSQVTVKCDNAHFDFSTLPSGACFNINSDQQYDNWNPKHEFSGFYLNFKYGAYAQYNIIGINYNPSVCASNFEIKDFQIQSCNIGIQFNDNCWRIRHVNGLVRWCNHILYASNNLSNSGENIHFEGCMFTDSTDINIGTDISFHNCSFDNITYIQTGQSAKMVECHFEKVNPTSTINQPFITLNGSDVSVMCTNCDFMLDTSVMQVPLFNTGTSYYKGLILNDCYVQSNQQNVNIASYLAASLPLSLCAGGGRLVVRGITDYESGPGFTTVPFSAVLNRFANGNAENGTSIPLTTYGSTNGTIVIDGTTSFTGTKSFKLNCAATQKVYAYVQIPVNPGEMVLSSLVNKFMGTTNASWSYQVDVLDINNNSLLAYSQPGTAYYNSVTGNGSTTAWAYSGASQVVIPAGAAYFRLYVSLINNDSSNAASLWLDEIIINSL